MNTSHIYQLIRRMGDGLVKISHRKKLLQWMANGKDAAEKDAALFQVWNETEGADITQMEAMASLAQVKARLGMATASPKRRYVLSDEIMKYAAIFLLPLITGVSVWLYMNRELQKSVEMVECFVPKGEQKKLVLPDGSSVMLNSGSLFVYPKHFNKDSRCVFLTGEAYFDVVHNEEHPFMVHTGRINIKVLGTSFNVEAYSDAPEITTTLKKGKVNVYPMSKKEHEGIVMNPDEQVIYNIKTGKMSLSKVNAEDYASWTEGDLHFVERSLAEVLKIIGRKYDVEFRYDNQIRLDELYTIAFKQEETIEQVMKVMKSLIGNQIDYSINEKSVYLYTVKKGGRGR